ncbi:hypothetical protein [Streptosporangium roseum]
MHRQLLAALQQLAGDLGDYPDISARRWRAPRCGATVASSSSAMMPQ